MDDLLALAEALDLDRIDLDFPTECGPGSSSQNSKWHWPPTLDLPWSVIHRCNSIHVESFPQSDVDGNPSSPSQRHRVVLFGESDEPLDLVTSSESSDPRCLYVMDHPGRNAQFKYWFTSGLIDDDSRRVTFREESSAEACWQPTSMSKEGDDAKNLWNLIRVVKADASPQDSQPETRVPALLTSRDKVLLQGIQPDIWESRCFMVGGSIMVAMAFSNLDEISIRRWCVWFNDKLCSWGMSDRTVPASELQVAGDVMADIDFTGNQLSTISLEEVVRLLSAFRRIHVRSLRISSNSLKYTALRLLNSFPYLCNLVFDDNNLNSDDLAAWIPEIIMTKQERYDILVAQDIPDENVKQALFMSVERNLISQPLELIARLQDLGINVCRPESTGCEPYSPCRMYGEACGVHLAGLTQQRKSSFV